MRRIVHDRTGLSPVAKPTKKPVVGEIDAPDRRVRNAHFGQTSVESEQADEAGRAALEVCDSENRPAVGSQTRKNVVAVLPHGLRNDERRIHGDVLEHLEPHPLAGDEAVSGERINRVRALHGPPQTRKRRAEGEFHGVLHRPASVVRRRAQVAARDQVRRLRHRLWSLDNSRNLVHRCHFVTPWICAAPSARASTSTISAPNLAP